MRFKQAVALFVGALVGMSSSVWAAQCDTDQLREMACGLSGTASADAVADAQVTLAARYMYGECVRADFHAASQWIRYAQANRHPDAHRLSAIWHRLWALPSPGKAAIVEISAKSVPRSSTTAAAPASPTSPSVRIDGDSAAAHVSASTLYPTADDPLCDAPAQHIRAVAYSPPERYRIRLANRCSADAIDTFIASLHGAGVQVTRQNGELTLQAGPATAAGRHALVCATYDVADVDVACPPMPAREIERLVPNDAKARFPGAIAVWKVAAPTATMALELAPILGDVDPVEFEGAWRPPYAVLRRQKGGATGAIALSIWAEPTAPSVSAQRCEIARVQADVPKPRAATPVQAPVACEVTATQACASCGAAAVPVPLTQGPIACQ